MSTAANRKWWTLGALTFSLFMIMLDNTVVNVALPAIQEGVGASCRSSSGSSRPTRSCFRPLVSGGKLADFLAGAASSSPAWSFHAGVALACTLDERRI